MDWTQEMKGAAMQDAAKVCELTDQLTAANKAIVALSEALEDARRPLALYKAYGWGDGLGVIPKVESALTTHAPAIEKARGGLS